MARDKDFKEQAAGVDRYFSDPVPAKEAPEKKEFYRINLKLDADLKGFLQDESWLQRVSVTQLLNQIIREYMEAHMSDIEAIKNLKGKGSR